MDKFVQDAYKVSSFMSDINGSKQYIGHPVSNKTKSKKNKNKHSKNSRKINRR